ncbi:unnamed protein product [Spirodela intermedia]|uniref:Uncharacterized protein n=1 Tax=Spirodela intermedia TaxID=51605 RepID=A0A7I8LGQ0_SPIIN|nr:unnamed protein product [Spirodela intermedia]
MGCCRTGPSCGRHRHRSFLVNPQIPRSCAGMSPLGRTRTQMREEMDGERTGRRAALPVPPPF